MNSVTPGRPREKEVAKEGAGKGVVLFCCALFLLFQIFSTIPIPLSPVQITRQLVISPLKNLKFAPSDQKLAQNQSQSLSSGNYHLAPFFFEKIAINYCDISLLMSIKGIGPSLAESIVAARKKTGGFATANDLLQVKGIGHGRLRQFTPYFDFSNDNEKK